MRAPSTIQRAETPRDARAEIGLRIRSRDVQPTVDQSVDQRTDDLRTIEHLSVLAADVSGEAIEVDDLAIEQDHGHFGPGLMVHGRSAPAGFRFASSSGPVS